MEDKISDEKLYRIQFTPLAYEDLENVFAYIYDELQNETAAFKLMDEIEEKIMHLTTFPLMGSLANDNYLGICAYRKIIIDKYIAFYLIDDDERKVVIMRVLFSINSNLFFSIAVSNCC